MAKKLYENLGGNRFKLLTESMNPDRAKLIREGLKKVFANAKKELSYDKIGNFGLGFIKDVSEARKCALREARDIAPGLGFTDHPETGTFVKENDDAYDAETDTVRYEPRDRTEPSNPPKSENRYARHNPEGGDITDLEDMGVWRKPDEAKKLMDYLMQCVDAGNFDLAHKTVDKLANLHN